MLIAGIGIIFSIIGTFFVRISESAGVNTAVVQKALNMGNWGIYRSTAIASYFLMCIIYYLKQCLYRGFEFTRNQVFGCYRCWISCRNLNEYHH